MTKCSSSFGVISAQCQVESHHITSFFITTTGHNCHYHYKLFTASVWFLWMLSFQCPAARMYQDVDTFIRVVFRYYRVLTVIKLHQQQRVLCGLSLPPVLPLRLISGCPVSLVVVVGALCSLRGRLQALLWVEKVLLLSLHAIEVKTIIFSALAAYGFRALTMATSWRLMCAGLSPSFSSRISCHLSTVDCCWNPLKLLTKKNKFLISFSTADSTEVKPKKVPGTIHNGKPKNNGSKRVDVRRGEPYYAVEMWQMSSLRLWLDVILWISLPSFPVTSMTVCLLSKKGIKSPKILHTTITILSAIKYVVCALNSQNQCIRGRDILLDVL